MGTMARQRQGTRGRGDRLWAMPMGARSGVAVCEGRKTAMIAAGTDRAWLPEVAVGSMIRLNFNGPEPGWAVVEVTACCHHEVLAQVPRCANGHVLRAFDAEGSWVQVLGEAMFDGGDPVPPWAMLQRASRGWYVIDFSVVKMRRGWCAAMGVAEESPI